MILQDDDFLSELLAALKAEEDDAHSYAQSEQEAAQIESLRDYYGSPYGDETPGRSAVVTREVFETIEWIRPDLMRLFASSGNVVYLEENDPADEQYSEVVGDFLNAIFFQDNPGYQVLDDFALDGLLQRRGIVAVYWRPAEYAAPEQVSGLTSLQWQELSQDPSLQIESEQPVPDVSMPDGVTWSGTIRRLTQHAVPTVKNIAPEDFRANGRLAELKSGRYRGHVFREKRGELMRQYPQLAKDIMDYSGTDVEWRVEEQRSERFRDEKDWANEGSATPEAEELDCLEEYIHYDANGDGHAELLKVVRINDLILEVQEVAEDPYASWTPIRVSHRWYGLSIHDITKDLQRIKTVGTRAALDSMYLSVVPRKAVDVTRVNLNDLLSVVPGATIRVNGPPGNAILPEVTPDLSASALQMMEYIDQVSEARTGVTRNAQGLDPDALNKTATGIGLMQSAAAARKEMIARNFAIGLEELFGKMYRMVCRNQDQPRQMKLSGKWVQVDPRSWSAQSRVRVHVGLGTGSREVKLAMLAQIQASQMAWVQQYGAATPVITPKHLYNTFEEMVRVMGYRSAEPFASEPPQGWAPQQSNPEEAKAQAEAQAKQAELQLKGQEAQAKLALSQQEAVAKLQLQERETVAQLDFEERKTSAQIEADREKMVAELQLKQAQMQMEYDLKLNQLAMEFQLKERQLEMEATLKREQMEKEAAIKREVGLANASAKGGKSVKANGSSSNVSSGGADLSDTRFGGEVG